MAGAVASLQQHDHGRWHASRVPLVNCSSPVESSLSIDGGFYLPYSSSRIRVMNHNWSATKQRLHLQSVVAISCHSVLSGDRIRQCGHRLGLRSVPFPCENGSAETTVAEGGRNPVAGHSGRTPTKTLLYHSVLVM